MKIRFFIHILLYLHYIYCNNCFDLIIYFCLYYFTKLIENQIMVNNSKNINLNYI